MLFHADKTIKESLFNIYKKDLLDRQTRKEVEISKEKKQDKNYIESIIKLNEDENRRRSMDKLKVTYENMNSYNQLWRGKDEERKNRYYKIFDPKINYPIINEDIITQNKPILSRNPSYEFNSKIRFDSQIDHVNNILQPDYLGVKNLENLAKNTKHEFQNFYRNCLDSQITTRVNIYDLTSMKHKEKEYNSIKQREQDASIRKNPCKFFLTYSWFLFIISNLNHFIF